ncbi:MAG TPA: DegT/DnrJ/EryC1/StrS family aminotransferase, partial [Gammaproteobacteria bacterium]
MSEKPLYVTQPSMPPLEEFVPYLERIWQSRILTNSGPLHQELERCLRDYLGVPQIALFNNGMTALVAALRVLDLKGEVITTPYSFVATSHA